MAENEYLTYRELRAFETIAKLLRGTRVDLEATLKDVTGLKACSGCATWKAPSAYKHRRATCIKCVNRWVRQFDEQRGRKKSPKKKK